MNFCNNQIHIGKSKLRTHLIKTLDEITQYKQIQTSHQIGGKRYSGSEVQQMLQSALQYLMMLYMKSEREKTQLTATLHMKSEQEKKQLTAMLGCTPAPITNESLTSANITTDIPINESLTSANITTDIPINESSTSNATNHLIYDSYSYNTNSIKIHDSFKQMINLNKNFIFLNKIYNEYNYKTDQTLLWNDHYAKHYENLYKDFVLKLEINNINELFISNLNSQKKVLNLNDKITNINNWKLSQTGGYSPEIIRSLIDNIGVKIIPIHEINESNKNIISLCLFNPKFKGNNVDYEYTDDRKPFHFYCEVLLNAIKTYNKYLPDWIIRLYVDDTIPNDENDKSLPTQAVKVIHFFKTDTKAELFNVSFDEFKQNKKHYSLIPVLFRYLALFDNKINTCFMGDVDNVCSLHLADILKTFSKSDNEVLIFKPVSSYDRNLTQSKCADNFLAGMIAFKKKSGTVLNSDIWHSFFIFIDDYFKNMSSAVQSNKCTIQFNTIKSPFYYGFEENGLTAVFALVFNKLKTKVMTIPLCWDTGMSTEILLYSIKYNEIDGLSNDFKNFLVDFLKLKVDNNENLFTNLNNYLYIYNFKHCPIMILLKNIIYHVFYNNIVSITYNDIVINVFADKSIINQGFTMFPFVSGYTYDFKEVFNKYDIDNKIDILYLYGNDISTKLIKLIDLFEKENYNDFQNIYNNIFNNIKDKLENNTNNMAIEYLEKMNKNQTMIFDNNMPYAYYNGVNLQILKSNNLRNIIFDQQLSKLNLNNFLNKQINLLDSPIFDINFDIAISLGIFCLTSSLLKQCNYKSFSTPFDWILSNNEIVYKCLEDDFKSFLNKDNYIDNKLKDDPINLNKPMCGHLFNEYMFMHHDPRIDEDYEYFNRCVNRFRKVAKDETKKVLYLQTLIYNQKPNESFNYYHLYQWYLKIKQLNYIKQFNMLFMIFTKSDHQSCNIVMVDKIDDQYITIMHIYTLSDTNGYVFPNELDNELVINIIKMLHIQNKLIDNSDTIEITKSYTDLLDTSSRQIDPSEQYTHYTYV
jgi:hypothetical protein